MAWQAMQFLAVAKAWSARTGAEKAAVASNANTKRFMVNLQKLKKMK
jgi:hypothetical protein